MKFYIVAPEGVYPKDPVAVTTCMSSAITIANHCAKNVEKDDYHSICVCELPEYAECQLGLDEGRYDSYTVNKRFKVVYTINKSGKVTDNRGVKLPDGSKMNILGNFMYLGTEFEVREIGVEAVFVECINGGWSAWIHQDGRTEVYDGSNVRIPYADHQINLEDIKCCSQS